MESEQSAPLTYILGYVPVGIALLDAVTLRILYVNPYLSSLLVPSWQVQGVSGRTLQEILPADLLEKIEPPLREAAASGTTRHYDDIPFEGDLETRGRTYWRITIVPTEREHINAELLSKLPAANQAALDGETSEAASLPERVLLLTIEDVTDKVRARMHIDAIHYISSAIARGASLPQVLDHVLQAVQELVGSTRCAVLLLEIPLEGGATLSSPRHGEPRALPRVTIAAQKGLHLSSRGWNPELGEHILLGQVVQTRRSLVVPDTSKRPEIDFPLLDDDGVARRPGSVLCVPIFEPGPARDSYWGFSRGAILGTIEVYHRRVRGLPAEEVELLEQFAQQVGLAIQNARLFQRNDQLTQDARRQVRQRENIMQAIPDGIIIYDARWRVAEINNTIRWLLGWTDEVVGLPIHEALARSSAIYLDRSPSIEEMVADLERYPQVPVADEFKMIGANGKLYAIRRSKAAIKDDNGNIFAYIVVYHDVTEQVTARESIEAQVVARTAELAQRNKALEEAQQALELEHSRLELLLERLPSGVVLISSGDHRIIDCNPQATRLLWLLRASGQDAESAALPGEGDTTPESFIGADIEALLRGLEAYGADGKLLPYEEQPLYLALHQGKAGEAELHITQDDNQPLYLLASAAPLRAADGSIANVVLVLQDITTVKALERAREDFFTTMAHELKTPLANIRAHLSALRVQDYPLSADEQMEYLKTADEQVERLVRMINQFLDASRVEAGALRLEMEPVLLPELFEEVQERLEALIASSNRTLDISLSPDLPAVQADYELIISVLINLLSNAFRYAPEGDAVRLEAETIHDSAGQPRGVELRVIDRGAGITPERQAELFTRFSTFAASRRPARDRPGQPALSRSGNTRWSPATGLGLYISRGIIEAHGSTLKLHSVPGEGTTFAFQLGAASLVKNEV
jgi:PAS domain S-box-containing protein